MAGQPVGFRPPLTSVLPVSAFLALGGVVLPSGGGWLLVVLGSLVFMTLRMRQLLVLHEDHLEVTVLRKRKVPWVDIRDFEPASAVRGGIQINTADGPIHAVAPCTWWGGPAADADLEVLRRELAARTRAA